MCKQLCVTMTNISRKREGEREGREGGRGQRDGRVGGRGEREGVERGWEGGGGRERGEGGSIQCSGNINYSFYNYCQWKNTF